MGMAKSKHKVTTAIFAATSIVRVDILEIKNYMQIAVTVPATACGMNRVVV
jgi:hypothetical protein